MAYSFDQIGPYEHWMLGPGKTYDLPGLMLDHQANISCVAEFGKPVDQTATAAIAALVQQDGLDMQARLPTLWHPKGFAPRFLPVLLSAPDGQASQATTGSDSVMAHLNALAAKVLPLGLKSSHVRVNFPIRGETLDLTFPQSPDPGPLDPDVDTGKPLVILAIIDHGIPFAHRDFFGKSGTRIDYCWSQSAPADGSGAVLFGREFTRDSINTLCRDGGNDEDAIYRKAGLLGGPGKTPMPLARKHSHGAHVLGTMAGKWPADKDPAQLRIIAVDLPSTSVWDTSGFGCDMFLLAAMHYILERAARIAAAYGQPDLPVVINVSYGISGGPQDGGGLLEAAFDEMIAFRRKSAPTALVMPSGNSFQDSLHARIAPQHFAPDPGGASRSAAISWLAPPNDMTSSYLELWFPAGASLAECQIELNPPPGYPAVPPLMIRPQDGGVDLVVGGLVVGLAGFELYRGQRWRAVVILAPSEPRALPQGNYGAAPAGRWTLTLHQPLSAPVLAGIDCRIHRDTGFGQGKTGARQSWFIDPSQDRFAPDGGPAQTDPNQPATKVRRFGAMNGMATGKSALVVAGYVGKTAKAAYYSGAGPETGSGPAKPVDLAAETERSAYFPGVVSSGTRSSTVVAQQGTSSAAPQAARALALCFLAGGVKGPTADNYLGLLGQSNGVTPVPADQGSKPNGPVRLGQFRLPPALL